MSVVAFEVVKEAWEYVALAGLEVAGFVSSSSVLTCDVAMLENFRIVCGKTFPTEVTLVSHFLLEFLPDVHHGWNVYLLEYELDISSDLMKFIRKPLHRVETC